MQLEAANRPQGQDIPYFPRPCQIRNTTNRRMQSGRIGKIVCLSEKFEVQKFLMCLWLKDKTVRNAPNNCLGWIFMYSMLVMQREILQTVKHFIKNTNFMRTHCPPFLKKTLGRLADTVKNLQYGWH